MLCEVAEKWLVGGWMCCGGESRKVSWTKKSGSPEPTPGAVATMMMMAPPAPYDLCLRHRASFKTRPIALGAIHHRCAAVVGAGDEDAAKMLTLMK